MSDPADYNPCACYLYYLRQSQEHCSETECYSPESLPGPGNIPPCDTSDFMMFFMIAFIGMVLYALRPKSLRQIGATKGADNDSDSSGEPPLPPPAVN